MEAFVNALAQWTSLEWVANQFYNGDGLPFTIWTFLMFVFGALVGARVERKANPRPKPTPKRKIARGFSGDVKAAAKAALEADDAIVLGQHWESVLAFTKKHPDVFMLADPIDYAGDMTKYQLDPEWRYYLKKHNKYLK